MVAKWRVLVESFFPIIGDCIEERETRKFEKGLNSKVKLSLYKTEFKEYLHGVSDAASRLIFKFRSGMHGGNDELGLHRGREGMKECLLCDNECESVSYVLWQGQFPTGDAWG